MYKNNTLLSLPIVKIILKTETTNNTLNNKKENGKNFIDQQ